MRKYKSTGTPARYARALAKGPDEEDGPGFDAAPGWHRGEEWAWAGLDTPASLARSESTRVDLFYDTHDTQQNSQAGSEADVDETFAAAAVVARKWSLASSGTDTTGPATPPDSVLVHGRFPSASPLVNEVFAPGREEEAHGSSRTEPLRVGVKVKTQQQQQQQQRKKQMGMQGYEPGEVELRGLGLGGGDVQFPCLYQAAPEDR